MQIVLSLFPQRYNPSAITLGEQKSYLSLNQRFKRTIVRNVSLSVLVEKTFADLIGFKWTAEVLPVNFSSASQWMVSLKKLCLLSADTDLPVSINSQG